MLPECQNPKKAPAEETISTALLTIVASPFVGLDGLFGEVGDDGVDCSPRGGDILYDVLGSAGWGAGTARGDFTFVVVVDVGWTTGAVGIFMKIIGELEGVGCR